MKFNALWITTEDFAGLCPIDVFHKELSKVRPPCSPMRNYHVHFRRSFTLDAVGAVKIRISADDCYKLYINGSFVCQGPAPAYHDVYCYNEADISEYLTAGENVIAVHVYYQGLINRVRNSGDNRQGMIAELISDGRTIIGTDKSWKYSVAREFSGDTTGYDTAFLENIDFNLEEKNWYRPDFDDSCYKNAVEKTDDDHCFRSEPTDVLDVYTVLPQRVVKIGDGHYFIDFGHEFAGQFKMTVCGEKNQRVTIMCGEETIKDNPLAVRYDMRCNCRYFEQLTLSGDTDEVNFYDYKAFRYVNVKTDIDNLSPESFCAVVRHHRFKEKCEYHTENKRLAEIWELCKNTLKYGTQEGFLDCPSREKGQYLGDFSVSGLAYMYLTGDTELYKKTLFDFAESARICKGLLSVAPCSHMQEIADFSLQYPMQVLNYYNYTGDAETLHRLYPTVCGLLEYFSQYERGDGLLENVNEKWNMVDWPKNLRDNYSVQAEQGETEIPCHNVINAYYIGALCAAEKIGHALGFEHQNKSESRKKAYIDAFYDVSTKLFYDTENKNHASLHSNALAAFFGIAPCEAHEKITTLIMDKGLSCGVQFSYFVLKALAKMGAYDEELRLLTNESEHSWVNMLREGATTCFEAWGKEQKSNTSLCHPWACAPIIVITEDIMRRS